MKLFSKMIKALFVGVILIFVSALPGNVFVAIAQPATSNLIVNGDFESGNTGFSSDYTFSPGNLGPAAVYDVLSDPSSAHFLATSFGDHTSGSGLMMAVNGPTSPGLVVWSQSATVTPNTDYEFSAWVASWFPASPAQLQFLINGSPIGTFAVSSTTGLWGQFATTWNSGSNTSAIIEIIDLNTAPSGNDFALDDLSFQSQVVPVDIDIKPGSFPNSINPRSQGVIPVAILTTDTFDATTVDETTVLFGPTGSEAAPVQVALEDVDGDLDTDMILHFNTQDAGIVCGDTSAFLTGETFSGQMIQASDSIKTAGCK